ncbi:MAG: phosphatase PAP2 family protein [Jatrophihabitantaceae bacterium]
MTDRDCLDVASAPAVDPWHRIRVGAALVYATVLASVVIVHGVPTGRTSIAVIIVVGLAISRLGTGWRRLGQVLLDWLPFTLVLTAYDKTRAVADAIGMPLHEADVVGWERALFDGNIPTVWMQQHLFDPQHVYWYDAVFTLVYTSHFIATPALAAVLWLRDRTAWLRFIARVVLLSITGLATYILFPEAPPWLAFRDGVIHEQVGRLSARGWIWLHAGDLRATLDHAQQDGTNPVAAMPSLHVAFACLVAIFVAGRMRSTWRWLLVLYPVAMGVTLVYCGEHYVVDLVAGALYAVAVHLAMNAWERHRAARVAARVAEQPVSDSDRADVATASTTV